MVITYLGMGLIKIGQGEWTLAINPISKEFDSKAPKFGADIALVSLKDPAYNGVENAAFGSKEPFVIDGPGEYEIGGIFVKGLSTEGPRGKINTVFTILLDGVMLCHLGALASTTLPPEVVEEIGAIDVVFVPLGGDTLNPKEALKLASSLEAKLTIPLSNGTDETELKTFLKEAGADDKRTDRLTLKKKDLEGKQGEIVVLATT